MEADFLNSLVSSIALRNLDEVMPQTAPKMMMETSIHKLLFALMRSVMMILGESVTPSLDLNFDPSQMFVYTNVITNSLMPLVYISAGFALGFSIIYMLKSAFSGRL